MCPKVTVLMSCYNAARWLDQAITSILDQTFKDFEFIIIDDGSTDETLKIINSYARNDDRIVVISKDNTGLADSLNVGLQMARGEWIARLDADDVAFSTRLERQIGFLNNHREIVLLGSGCTLIDDKGLIIKNFKYPSVHRKIVKKIEKMGSPFPHSSVVFKKEIVQSIGGYRNCFNGAEDADLWLRIAENYTIACLPVPLIKLRKHSESITANPNIKIYALGIASRVCHFLRRAEFHDPCDMNDDYWNSFLDWLQKEIGGEVFILKSEFSSQLRNQSYLIKRGELLVKLKTLRNIFGQLIGSSFGQQWLKEKLFGSYLAEKIAQDWIFYNTNGYFGGKKSLSSGIKTKEF